jgi:hypothetical protein
MFHPEKPQVPEYVKAAVKSGADDFMESLT